MGLKLNSGSASGSWVKMSDLNHATDSASKNLREREEEDIVGEGLAASSSVQPLNSHAEEAEGGEGRGNRRSYSQARFRVYKRRWFGLAQLVLLNVVVSWDVCISSICSFVFIHSLVYFLCFTRKDG